MKIRHAYFLTIAILLLISALSTSANAGWVDDWIDQKTETSPGYFKGQQRGYYTAGGFSARWYQGNDYLFTAEPPRVKYGCGGIDVNLGAFSLLEDPDYLMNKFERIIGPAVASYAFDIALDTLCPQCAKAMKSLESISDMLNQIQINDCQASQVLVAKTFGKEDAPKYRAAVDSWEAMTQGVEDSWHEIKEGWQENNDKPLTNDADKITGCPGELRSIFDGYSGKSILQVSSEMRGYPDSYMDLARGLVGDVIIESRDQGNGNISFIPKEIPPCPQNKTMSTEGFLKGSIYARPSTGGDCYQVNDANRELAQWAQQTLEQIADNIRNDAPLTAAQQSFIDSFPLPIYSTLKSAVKTNQEEMVVVMFADIAARGYAFGMLSDLYEMIGSNIRLVESVIDRQGGYISPNCMIENLIASTKTAMEQMRRRLAEQAMAIGQDYQRTAGELGAYLTVVTRLDETAQKSSDETAETMRKDNL